MSEEETQEVLVVSRKVASRYRGMRWVRYLAVPSDELEQVAALGILRGLPRYNADKGPRPQWMYACGSYEVSHYLRDFASVVRIPRPVYDAKERDERDLPVIHSLDFLLRHNEDDGTVARSLEAVTADTDAERPFVRVDLMELVCALPIRLRSVVFLYYFADMVQETIARVMGISQTEVARRLRTARRQMRRAVAT